jgi:hypothetical protein
MQNGFSSRHLIFVLPYGGRVRWAHQMEANEKGGTTSGVPLSDASGYVQDYRKGKGYEEESVG